MRVTLVSIVCAEKDHHFLFAQKAKAECAVGRVVVRGFQSKPLPGLENERGSELENRRVLPIIGDVDQLSVASPPGRQRQLDARRRVSINH